MDGAECFKHKGMVIAGLKIIDHSMNKTLMESIFQVASLSKNVMFTKPKRDTFAQVATSSSSAIAELAAATAAAVQQPTQEQQGNAVKRRRLSTRAKSGKERAPDDENSSAIACQSALCILLVRFKIGKDDLDTTSK